MPKIIERVINYFNPRLLNTNRRYKMIKYIIMSKEKSS